MPPEEMVNKHAASAPSKMQMLDLLEEINSPWTPTRMLWIELDEATTPEAERVALAKAIAWLRKRGYYPW